MGVDQKSPAVRTLKPRHRAGQKSRSQPGLKQMVVVNVVSQLTTCNATRTNGLGQQSLGLPSPALPKSQTDHPIIHRTDLLLGGQRAPTGTGLAQSGLQVDRFVATAGTGFPELRTKRRRLLLHLLLLVFGALSPRCSPPSGSMTTTQQLFPVISESSTLRLCAADSIRADASARYSLEMSIPT